MAWVHNEIHAENDLPGISNDSGLKSPCIQKPVQTKNATSTVASVMPQHDEGCVSPSAKSGKGKPDTVVNPLIVHLQIISNYFQVFRPQKHGRSSTGAAGYRNAHLTPTLARRAGGHAAARDCRAIM